jgi:hypothetical protein
MTVHLFGYAGISEYTGVSEATLRVWKSRGKLPEPDYIVNNGIATPAWAPAAIWLWWNLEGGAAAREKMLADAARKAAAKAALLNQAGQ